jgi:proline iminopeptidase
MKQTIAFLFLLLTTFSVNGQSIYSKTYGNKNDTPLLFIHGGPSGNSTLFEATTAQKLADSGFYVIVYDRRGEGRSTDSTATFTYQEAFDDLNNIYQTYTIEKAHIIGHSFGGLVATLYANKHPEKVKSLVLAGALFSQQETYDHILKTVKQIYENKNDTAMLKKVGEVENLNKNSAEYRKGCYELAGENDFFKMPNPTKEADKLRQEYENSDLYKNNIRNHNAPILFYKNEPLKNIDTKPILQLLKSQNVTVFAVYGKQDGIFSASQKNDMKVLVGKRNFTLIDNCSHYLFVDQQKTFINSIEKWIKR